jgi:large subunit ribosomal protein L3
MMIEGLLGKKLGVTNVFMDNQCVTVTVVQAGDCFVTQKKVVEKDGYDAIQLGFGDKKDSRETKALRGHFKKAGTGTFYHLREFRRGDFSELKLGQKISAKDVFVVGDVVDVTGTSKGKGFAGVMKRHNFSGGPGGHGSKHNRAPGSIGQSASPSKVFKGRKMPGQMGDKRITGQNLKIVGIKEEDNILLVKGSVPGAINSVFEIKKSIKR